MKREKQESELCGKTGTSRKVYKQEQCEV